MISDSNSYSIYLKFIQTFTSAGFKGIDRENELILQVEEFTANYDQFFYVADTIQMKILFTSSRSTEMMGIPPDELSFYHFMEASHPDDLQRLNLGRTKLLSRAQDLYIANKGDILLSTNLRIRNSTGIYSNFLVQNYLFYAAFPTRTVYLFKLHTNIDWCKKIKRGYHYYIGNDLRYFRYPDENLLAQGNVFSVREFEIIKLIEAGLSSEQIAEKLFISPFTVSTHRANILEKCGKLHISDLIYDLKERGLL
jgi:DNA-binding CsgD family transcriptional regulator